MQHLQRFLRVLGLVSLLLASAGCTYQAALQRLPPEERTAFHAYRKVMTSRQANTYLAQETAAARAAYLETIGIAQRFRTLPPPDQDAVMAGYIRQGMSADALRFLWGDPYHTRGHTHHYEYWHYVGSTFDLAERGNSSTQAGTTVIVYLIADKVDWWLETTPTGIDAGGDKDTIRH